MFVFIIGSSIFVSIENVLRAEGTLYVNLLFDLLLTPINVVHIDVEVTCSTGNDFARRVNMVMVNSQSSDGFLIIGQHLRVLAVVRFATCYWD